MHTRSSEYGCHQTGFDPIAEVLHDFRLSGSYYCRSELRAPWGLEISGHCGAGFHFVAEGGCYLRWGSLGPLRLERGDFVLLPRGGSYILSDSPNGAAVSAHSLVKEALGQNASLLRNGGDGEITILVGGGARFADSGLHPLVALMPDVLHIREADSQQDSMLRAMVAAMGAEALARRPGGATLMTRLADVLVLQALRWWLDHDTAECSGWLRALRDPQIGRALAVIHKRPEQDWTVAALAKEVHISRSVFSERFTQLVGAPPMHYLTRWRMHLAGRWLREENLGIAEVAARLGYQSEPSFSRAFKRHMGLPPSAMRRGKTEEESFGPK
jgi:AraC-like DNA-binding protein